MSPVELRQYLLEAAIDELGKNDSNVVQDIVVHRVVERVIQEAMPYLDSGKGEAVVHDAVGAHWYSRLWRRGEDQ